jgi:hypothetical protein
MVLRVGALEVKSEILRAQARAGSLLQLDTLARRC